MSFVGFALGRFQPVIVTHGTGVKGTDLEILLVIHHIKCILTFSDVKSGKRKLSLLHEGQHLGERVKGHTKAWTNKVNVCSGGVGFAGAK